MEPTLAQKLDTANASILTLTTERDALKASVEKLTGEATRVSEAHVKELDGLKAEATTLREQVKAANEKADKAEKSASAKAAEIAAAAGHAPVGALPNPSAPGAVPAAGSPEALKKLHAEWMRIAAEDPAKGFAFFQAHQAELSQPLPASK